MFLRNLVVSALSREKTTQNMAANTVEELINSLQTSADKLSTLERLKTLSSSIPPSDLRQTVGNVSIAPIFNCLDTNNDAELQVCCDVLDILLTSLSSEMVIENLRHHFHQWLQHGTQSAQSLCLLQLSRASHESPEILSRCQELLVAVAEQLQHESEEVAGTARKILVNLGTTANGLEAIFGGTVLDMLQNVMSKSDTVRYRVYQLAVELSNTSDEAFRRAVESGLLLKLVNEIYVDDILLQLNCLELLSDLAQSRQALIYMDQMGVVRKLEEMMSIAESSPMGVYLLPGLMKFFGVLARFHPQEVLNNFQTFAGLMFLAVSGSDPSIKGLAIDTVGFIGSTVEGKIALHKQGNKMTDCVTNLGKVIKDSPSDMRVRSLEAVASLMKLQIADQTQELLQITEGWFGNLCTNPFDVVWSIAKQPFVDLQLAGMRVLQSLALLPWGQQLMNNAAGFKEYLLDRSTITNKGGKEAKFEVVKNLIESPTAVEIFGAPFYVQLREFFEQGPFYVRVQAEVAFEET